MSKIILLKDVYEMKEQKEKELLFYKEKLIELQDKLYWLERDLALTKNIIRMIEEEKVTRIDKDETT
jgi:cob(I)alamin adenosyltransferase